MNFDGVLKDYSDYSLTKVPDGYFVERTQRDATSAKAVLITVYDVLNKNFKYTKLKEVTNAAGQLVATPENPWQDNEVLGLYKWAETNKDKHLASLSFVRLWEKLETNTIFSRIQALAQKKLYSLNQAKPALERARALGMIGGTERDAEIFLEYFQDNLQYILKYNMLPNVVNANTVVYNDERDKKAHNIDLEATLGHIKCIPIRFSFDDYHRKFWDRVSDKNWAIQVFLITGRFPVYKMFNLAPSNLLQYALLQGNSVEYVDLAEDLLKYQNDWYFTSANNDLPPPLHAASQHGLFNLVHSLLYYGAPIDQTFQFGFVTDTALSLAIRNQKFKIVQLLVENEAKMDIPSTGGTAIELAKVSENKEIRDYIASRTTKQKLG